MLSDIRRPLGASRRAVRMRLFGNNQPGAINLRNRRYHAQARRIWAARAQRDGNAAPLASRLATDGYVRIAPAGAEPLFERLQQRADQAFATPEFCVSPIDGAILNCGCVHRTKHPETSHRDVAV